MSSLTGDGAPKELRDAADAEESTEVDSADYVSRETAKAIRQEIRSAYHDGVMDRRHPDL